MKNTLLISSIALLALAACDNPDRTGNAIETAEKHIKAGAYTEAVRSYENALDGTEKTAEIHYKIALLYDDKLKRPLDAIHHYDRFLSYNQKSKRADQAKMAREDCASRLRTETNKGGFMTTSEAVRLRNENESLRKLINDLRNPKAPPPPRVANPNKPDAMPPKSRTHTVVAGDTLASIALKYYKSRAMASQIKDANFNQLNGKDMIHPGQILIIPERPSR